MKYQLTKNLLYLTIFSSPLYIIRFHIGLFPTTLLEILILLTTLFWILENLQNYRHPDSEHSRGGRIPWRFFGLRPQNDGRWKGLPLTLFIIAALTSTLISPDKHGAFGTFKAYIVEPILIYIVTITVIKTEKDEKNTIAAMAASGALVSLWVIAQAAFGWLITNPAEAALGRAHGPYNTANAVGLYLGPIFAILIAGIQSSESKTKKKLLGYCVIVLLLLAILLSRSTGALIATAVIVACFLTTFIRHPEVRCPSDRRIPWRFFGPRPQNDGRWGTVALISYSLVSLIFFFFVVPHLTPKTSWTATRPENYTTTTIRLCLWEGTRNMLLERPIFGAGLSGFKELYAEKYVTCDSEPLEYPHNLTLNFWAEMGILGLISFLWLVCKALSPVILGSEATPESRFWIRPSPSSGLTRMTKGIPHIKLGITLALIYILIHGLVDVPYFKNDLSLQFWLLLALSSLCTP